MQSLPLHHHELRAWQTGGVHVRTQVWIKSSLHLSYDDRLIVNRLTVRKIGVTRAAIPPWNAYITAQEDGARCNHSKTELAHLT